MHKRIYHALTIASRRRQIVVPVLLTLIVVLGGCGRSAANDKASPKATATGSASLDKGTATPTIDATATAYAEATSAADQDHATPVTTTSPPTRPSDAISVSVDVADQPDGEISPLIYGMAVRTWQEPFGDGAYFRDLGITMLRWGGNQTSRFNWELNTLNSGTDWYFANAGHGWPDAPAGQTGNNFVRMAQAAGAEPLLTIPTLGYVARDGDEATQSQDVPDDGGPPLAPGSEAIPDYDPGANQQSTSIRSYARKDTAFAYPPDREDESVYQDEWIHHLTHTFGPANDGGVRFYSIDNEPDLWSHTHRDVHPVRMGYDATLNMFLEYATAIKAVDPGAKIVAPDVSGVVSLFFSELDRGDDNFGSHADRLAHGDVPYLVWLLDQIRRHDQRTGQRTLDVLSFHHYPQSDIYPEGNTSEQNALRLRSTRQLWDPEYTDESWLQYTEAAQLHLIPRLQQLVDRYYPGTEIAITEWNYGNDEHINGGLAIVDVLGIFGREGLDMATYWNFPEPGTPGASAFKLYRNYDGHGGHFGDQRLPVVSSDEQIFGAYGSRDSATGDVLIMTVNKQPDKPIDASFKLTGLNGKRVEVYQFSSDHTEIRRVANAQVENGTLNYIVPSYAATLFVIKN